MGGGSSSSSSSSTTTTTQTQNASLQGNEGIALAARDVDIELADPGALEAVRDAVDFAAAVSLGALEVIDKVTERGLESVKTVAQNQSKESYDFAREASSPDRGTTEKILLWGIVALGVVFVVRAWRARR